MPGAIDYAALRTSIIALVKSFGKTAPMSILRTIDGAAPDPALPWRRNASSFKEFKFIGCAFTVGFPAMGMPTSEDDKTIIVPGDIVVTAAQGDPTTVCGDIQYTDRLVIGAKEYQVLGIQDVTPDALPIIIKLRCRAWPQHSSPPPTQF